MGSIAAKATHSWLERGEGLNREGVGGSEGVKIVWDGCLFLER